MTDDNETHLLQLQPNSSLPSTPLPLNLSGFLNGNTIQLQGDTENIQFSVQFNINPKHTPKFQTVSLSSSFSSHVTPISNNEEENQNLTREYFSDNAIDWAQSEEHDETIREENTILTRLRSGVLSPVKYFPRNSSLRREGEGKRKMKMRREEDVLERMIRRHRFPVRPCTSYTFFVMTTWGRVANSSSFGETSKRLGDMWCKLPLNEKKVYEDMALRDNKRYRRQCLLLKDLDNDEDGLEESKTLDLDCMQ